MPTPQQIVSFFRATTNAYRLVGYLTKEGRIANYLVLPLHYGEIADLSREKLSRLNLSSLMGGEENFSLEELASARDRLLADFARKGDRNPAALEVAQGVTFRPDLNGFYLGGLLLAREVKEEGRAKSRRRTAAARISEALPLGKYRSFRIVEHPGLRIEAGNLNLQGEFVPLATLEMSPHAATPYARSA